jgi:hypothetical protein
MSIDFDYSELERLVADMEEAPRAVIPNVVKAIEVTAFKMKGSWRAAAQRLNGRGHAKRYPAAVDYEMILNRNGEIGADIGPDPTKSQGTLGILEDAPGGVRSTPQRSRDKAIAENIVDFERGLAKATEVNGL